MDECYNLDQYCDFQDFIVEYLMEPRTSETTNSLCQLVSNNNVDKTYQVIRR